MPTIAPSLDLSALRALYAQGDATPSDLVRLIRQRQDDGDAAIWISRPSLDDLLARAAELDQCGPSGLPLYGIPFAVKDNIDVAGFPTTAACPAYAYRPAASATIVAALEAAGAIMVGKTNLDQFATGLVGTRTPYGTCGNAFDPAFIPGGSSSGSAVAVALGMAGFALGTDTAGSGRVPAAFNNLIGLKPSKGVLSTHGVVPACRSLDCVSIFALNAADARDVFAVARVFDPDDAFARPWPADAVTSCAENPILAVPRDQDLEFFGDAGAQALFNAGVARAAEAGAEILRIDFTPFLEAAALLYEGPWVAERFAAVGDFITSRPDEVHPVTRAIIAGGAPLTASDAFKAFYRLADLRRQTESLWAQADALLIPTAGTIYTREQVAADPVRLNSNLGRYTNFMNLLDLSAIAVPAGFLPNAMPLGITLAAPAFHDEKLLALADRLHRTFEATMGATGVALPASGGWPEALSAPKQCLIAVCGAHMSGLPLNHQLTERGGRLIEATHTAPCYRLHALKGSQVARPGMVRVAQGGARIPLEIWSLPETEMGSFMAGIASPLGLGSVALSDGRTVTGFLCEAYAAAEAEDITHHGGWRNYLASAAQPNKTCA